MSTSTEADRARAREVLRSCLVWDNHGCMPVGRPGDLSFLPQLEQYRAAEVDAVMLNVGFGEMGVEDTVRTLASIRHWINARPDDYLLLHTAEDAVRAKDSGRLAVGFDIEGANAIADQLSLIELYHALGVRWMLLAYNRNNRVGGGCQDEDGGLTSFGRSVVAEMERVGMQVCLSHTGYRTARDVLALATKPVIFSHSNARAIHDHPRNIPDDLIRACAATGGVVGVNGVGIFLGNNDTSDHAFARHIDHIVSLVGAAHAAIALDYVFDRGELEAYRTSLRGTFPPGLGYELECDFVAPRQLVGIVQVLLDWGYSRSDLEAILGGNLLRVARGTWGAQSAGSADRRPQTSS